MRDEAIEQQAKLACDTYIVNATRPSVQAKISKALDDLDSTARSLYDRAVDYQYLAMTTSGIDMASLKDKEYSLGYNYEVSKSIININGVLINGLSKALLDKMIDVLGVGGSILR